MTTTELAQSMYGSLKTMLSQEVIGDRFLRQEELDLGKGRNTNQFSYKGQFSPDVISNLLKHYAKDGSVVFDPFVGSGTVLFEAARKNLSAYGVEINPAGYEMSRTIIFVKLNRNQREQKFEEVLKLIKKIKSILRGVELDDALGRIAKTLKDPFVANIFKNAYINLLKSSHPHTKEKFLSLAQKHFNIVLDLPYTKIDFGVHLTDARTAPLKSKSVDLIITSPPYINVFNYHQHHREYIDKLHNNALIVAKSEFGANRKHRQNRFLTVTQYILDMIKAFEEMQRVLKTSGRLILIIGKSSKVRGVDFRNDHIIGGVASIVGYQLIAKQERKFINQYGETIYEEILHFTSSAKSVSSNSLDLGRKFAIEILMASYRGTQTAIKKDIFAAIEQAATIEPSPIFK